MFTITLPRETLDLNKTLNCGQCFRWFRNGDDGVWTGVVGSAVVSIEPTPNGYRVCGADEDWFTHYFDLDTQYIIPPDIDGYARECAKQGAGIRILRQDTWETLASFVISQRSSIGRIQTCVARLCRAFGEPIGGEPRFAFPTPRALARQEHLNDMGLGYRAPYILSLSREIDSGSFDLSALAALGGDEAVKRLMTLRGVGVKVAECVALFGLHRLERFPIDVHISRAIAEKNLVPSAYGPHAGLIQQYIFRNSRGFEL